MKRLLFLLALAGLAGCASDPTPPSKTPGAASPNADPPFVPHGEREPHPHGGF